MEQSAQHQGVIFFRSAVGWLRVLWNGEGLCCGVEFYGDTRPETMPRTKPPAKVLRVILALEAYFSEKKPVSKMLWESLDEHEWSKFQKRVFWAVFRIPFGETRTYGEIAKLLGLPLAGRAVGNALGQNPYPIVIPCHRVTGAKAIGGFMGKASARSREVGIKAALLTHEGFKKWKK